MVLPGVVILASLQHCQHTRDGTQDKCCRGYGSLMINDNTIQMKGQYHNMPSVWDDGLVTAASGGRLAGVVVDGGASALPWPGTRMWPGDREGRGPLTLSSVEGSKRETSMATTKQLSPQSSLDQTLLTQSAFRPNQSTDKKEYKYSCTLIEWINYSMINQCYFIIDLCTMQLRLICRCIGNSQYFLVIIDIIADIVS